MSKINKGNSRTKNTVLNLTSGIIGEVIIYSLEFITRTVFVRTLGRNYLGISGLFTNILALLSLADLGIGTALNYRFYKPLKEKDESRLSVLMDFYKKMYFIIGSVIFILGCFLMPFLRFLIKDFSLFDELNLNVYLIFFLYLFQAVSTYWFFAYRSAIVKADQKEYYLNVVGYIVTLATNIFQIVILLTMRNYIIYLIVVIAMNIVQGFVNAIIANKMFPFVKTKSQKHIEKEEAKEIFKDCGSISLFSISSQVLKSTDNLVLSAFMGLGIVGLYSNYLMIYNALKKIIKRLIRSAQASLGNLFADANNEVRFSFFMQMNCFMVLFCGTASVCVAVLADEFITTWLGSEYVIKMPFSLLVALELYTIGIKLVLEQVRDVIGLFQKVRWRPVLGMCINIVVSITLVNICGIYGVLLGTLISEWATTLIVDPRMVFKYGFNQYKPVNVFYYTNGLFVLELTVIGLLNYWFTKNVWTGLGWISFILHSIVCAITTVVFLVIVNLHNQYMRQLMMRGEKMIGKLIKRGKSSH